jgi:protein-S-isoprenylcysteine O-methyltransferase Ste14
MRPWDVVFVGGFVVYAAIRGVFERRSRSVATRARHLDGRERALLGITMVGVVLLPGAYLMSSCLAFADVELPAGLPWCGVPVMAAGLWLFWRAHRDLGPNWSVTLEVRVDHRLVEHGVYARVRHPMYAAIFLFSLAQGLMLANWLAGWSAFLAFGALYLLRVRREEALMLGTFGGTYAAYMKRTGRLWPRWRTDAE